MTNTITIIDETFFELLVKAQEETFTNREITIFNARYGVGSFERRHTLQEIGETIGVTRERIRQILLKCDRKFKSRAYSQQRRGLNEKAAVQLLNYLQETVKPKAPDFTERLVSLVQAESSAIHQKEHVIDLIVHILFSLDEEKEVLRITHQRLGIHKFPITKSISRMFSRILWPSHETTISDEYIQSLHRQREIKQIFYEEGETGNSHAGEYFSEKLGRTVQYESDTEYMFLKRLEIHPDVIFYQEQPFCIQYESSDKNTYKYYPDIFVVLRNKRGFVIEIKPRFDMPLYKNIMKGRTLWRFCCENGFGMLITDGYHDIIELRDRPVPSEAETALLSRLEQGSLHWDEYYELRNEFQIQVLDFLTIVLRNRLIWNRQPFRLQKPSI